MSEFRYDSYCGLYCGACDILAAYKNGLETGAAPQWSELPPEFANNLPFNAQKAEIKCYGCKTDTVFAGCSKCFIRKCARKKVGIETCLDCERYPCYRVKIMGFAKKLLKIEAKLPHLKAIVPNLEVIRNKGVQFWLEEQRGKWQCPHCGKRLSWYRPSCPDRNSHGEHPNSSV